MPETTNIFFVSHSSGGWEVQDESAAGKDWLPGLQNDTFLLHPHKWRDCLMSLIIRTQITFTRAPPSWHIMSQCPDLQTISWGLGSNIWILVGQQGRWDIQFWRRKWQPTPGCLPGKSRQSRQRNMVGWSSWGHKRVRHNLTKITTIFSPQHISHKLKMYALVYQHK